MMPVGPPDIPEFDIAGTSIPASATGGDFFDYIQLKSGELLVVVGDASGHGFGPALLAATTKSYFRALAATSNGLRVSSASTPVSYCCHFILE